MHTLVLVSLGSLLPIASYFPIDQHECDIHLIDAHRPYNLENIFGSAVNDGLGINPDRQMRNKRLLGDVDGEGDPEQPHNLGRIWIWGDGDESKLTSVKKSWEALEVSIHSSRMDQISPG